MRILITGTSGLLGLNLAMQARETNTVIGVDRTRLAGLPFEQIQVNLLETGQVEHTLEVTKPDWLVHCAALANLEACESDPALATRLNTDLPGELATACACGGVRMVQISTDAVFDGTQTGLYTEEDEAHPLSVYARTKLDGERAVLAANPQVLVARVNFYGFSRSGERSLAEFFIKNLSAGVPMKGFRDVMFNPTFVGDLADLLICMLELELSGVYHTVSPQVMSKHAFGVALARRFGWDESLIVADSVDRSGLVAQRSHNLGLSVHKLSTGLGKSLPLFFTGLERFYTQYQQGYPQKIKSYPQQ